jgi:hypothetical protein
MKKNLIYLSTFILLLLFDVDNSQKAFGQTKTIVYDWNKGFAQPLPFDELFFIELQNKPENITSVQLIIKKCDKKYIGEVTAKNDTAYFDSLPIRMELSFTDKNLIAPTYTFLRPNEYYLCELKPRESKPLSDDEKIDLNNQLFANDSLKLEVYAKFVNQDYLKLKADTFNNIVYKYIKKINSSYEVNTKTLPIDNDDVNNAIAGFGASLLAIGRELNSDYEMVKNDSQYNVISTAIKDLFTIQKNSNKPIALLRTSVDDFENRLNDLKTLIPINDSTPQELKNININIDNSILPKLQNAKPDITNWITALNKIVQTNIISTYKIISLGNTIPSSGNTSTYDVYTSQTFGWGYSPKTDNGLLYFSFSIFPRPVNNDVPFSNIDKSHRWKVKVGFNLGLTLSDMTSNKSGIVSGLGY